MTISDEEVFAEFRAEGFDPEVVAAELRAHIEGLVAESGKPRLTRARAGLAEARADRAASNAFHRPLSREQAHLAQFAPNQRPPRDGMNRAPTQGQRSHGLDG